METQEYGVMRECEDSHAWYRALRALLQEEIAGSELPAKARVLDVGCGTGANLALLEDLLPQTLIFGVDIHPVALDFCRSRRLRADLIRGSAHELPLASHSVDFAVGTDVFSHAWVKDQEALRECRRILKPGGRLLVNVPAFEILRGRHDKAVLTGRRYRRDALEKQFLEAGFRVRKIFYWNFLFFPALLIQRLLSRAQNASVSDLKSPPPLWNSLLTGILLGEQALSKYGIFPFGTSLFAVCEK